MGMSVDDAPQQGDLFFWPGHVALVADSQRIIHANAHHMAVAYEPIQDAIERIGPVTAHKRLQSINRSYQLPFEHGQNGF